MNNGNGNGDNLDWIKEAKPAKLVSQKLTVKRRNRRKGLIEVVSPTVRYSEQFLKKIGKVRCKGKDWYIYEKGKWVKVKEDVFLPDVIDVIPMEDRNSKRVSDLITFVRQGAQLGREEAFCGAMKCIEDGCYLLNFSNGIMKLRKETGEIVEWLGHDAKYMFTSSLGEYIEGKDCPFYKEVERQVLAKEADRILLKHWFASTLLPDSRFECALFCIGNGSNGKSILTEVLANSIGEEVRSALTFHQICGNERKHVHRLEEKLVNVSTETESRMVEENSIFKNIVSGEPFETEQIYREGFKMQTNVKLCFLTNHLPQFKYGTEAESRRIRFIQFLRKFDEDSRDLLLKEKLVKEQTGILSMLVRRLPRVCRLDEMVRGSVISQRIYTNFSTNNDIVAMFLKECIEDCSKKSCVIRNNMWRVFESFCRAKETNFKLTSGQFFRRLKKLRPELSCNYKIRLGNLNSTYAYRGITFTDYGYNLLEQFIDKSK